MFGAFLPSPNGQFCRTEGDEAFENVFFFFVLKALPLRCCLMIIGLQSEPVMALIWVKDCLDGQPIGFSSSAPVKFFWGLPPDVFIP